ncbi:glycosyltransferase family 2 protein [Streptomyces bomunensis]|uniref:Hyaluronan synthase n=1 Tax=Streptomyces montanisoli TaxID=2798581 RepID=A0A940M9K2_9ACTN|nr:glycosyltransferase family 2 protein [Streptomyces montanisoli]
MRQRAARPPAQRAAPGAAGVEAAGRLERCVRRVDPPLRQGVRRVIVTVCLLPLLLLLARESLRLPTLAPFLAYGFVVLAGTTGMLYVAYTRYEDPADEALPIPVRSRGRAGRESASFPLLGEAPGVALLVAVKDERERIEECVRSMAAAAACLPGARVVIVDDCSQDGTVEVLRRLRDELGATLIELPRNVGKKHALVQACAVVDSEVIAFTGSDCVLAPDALRRCVRALVRDPEFGAVSGHCRALNADAGLLTRVQDVWYEGQFRVAKAAEASFGSVTCVSGPLAVFRRDAVRNYLPAWADDRFLGAPFRFATDRQLTGYVLGQAWRGAALKRRYADSPFVSAQDYPERRWRVGYVRSARVWTDVPATFRSLLRQQVRWKKSFIRNLFFTGSFMWRRGPAPAVLYYGHVLWVAAAPVMAFRHLVWGPAHGTFLLAFLYLCGVILKGCVWGLAYRADHPGDTHWRYRPVMSVLSSVLLAWLLPYSLLTLRRGVWTRGTA